MKKSKVEAANLQGYLAFVKYGHDPEAARDLMKYFHERITKGLPFNQPVLLEYLGHAFGQILNENKSADEAFGLKLARGKYPRPNTTERDAIAAAYMVLLMRSGRTWEEAKGEAANFLFPDGTGDKAVETAYSQCRDEFHALTDKVLLDMLPDDTPVIKPVMTG
jgi:hypothetical protein